VYIAPLPEDVPVAVMPEPEVVNKPGNRNDSRKSTADQFNVRVGGSVKEHSTPAAANRSRKEESQNETTTLANQRPRSHQNLTRTMSDGYIGRYEGRKQAGFAKNASQQWETTSGERSEHSAKRKSLDEAAQRIENEVVEAIRREQELR